MEKTLSIAVNRDEIEASILAIKNEFEEDRFVAYGDITEYGDPTLTKEQYMTNVDKFLEDFRAAIADLDSIIMSFPKKKNGTFNRKNVKILAECNNCEYICEWHNTWIYKVIKVSAFDDVTLHITFTEKVDTPA